MARIPIILIIAFLITPLIARADTINGCVKQKNGKLRIVGDPGQCTDKEAVVSWNTEGPEGPQGDPAAAPAAFQLVGFTAQPFQVRKGTLALTAACAGELPGSRSCADQEILDTTGFPAGLSGLGWYRKPGSSSQCSDWISASPTKFGDVVIIDALIPGAEQFGLVSVLSNQPCSESYPVACCAPVP